MFKFEMNERLFFMNSRKEKILNSARLLFSEKGFAATGLREVADKAGVSLGNIYNHFKNKDELFQQIFDPGKIIDSLNEVFLVLKEDFPFNIDQLIISIKKTIDSNQEYFKLIFIDLIEFDGRNTNQMLEFFIVTGKKAFKSQLDDKSRMGKLKKLDYEFFIRFFIVSIISFFASFKTLPAIKNSRYSDTMVADMLSEVILKGISR